MLVNIIIAIWVAIVLFVIGGFLYVMNRKVVYKFQEYNKVDLPYIALDIQGKTFNMLLDSGASVSVIGDKSLNSIEYEESKRKVELCALTDDSIPSRVVKIPFTVNKKKYTEEFVVYPESDIAGFESKYGIAINGLLSKEFFDKTKGKIDFKNLSVAFS